MAEVQIKPLEEIIFGAELDIFVDITIVVTALGHMSTVDTIALLLATKRSSDLAQHGYLGDPWMIACLTHLGSLNHRSQLKQMH